MLVRCACCPSIHLREPVEFWRHQMYSDEMPLSTPPTVAATGSLDYAANDTTTTTTAMEHSQRPGRGSVMVWGAISYDWKSPLVFLEGTGKKGVQALDYYNQVLVPVVGPAFNGLLDYEGMEEGGLYVEDQVSVHGTKGRWERKRFWDSTARKTPIFT